MAQQQNVRLCLMKGNVVAVPTENSGVRDFKVSQVPGGTPNNPRICHSAHSNAER